MSIGGLLFGDAYYVASHHTAEGDGAAGFVLRRGYLTFNAAWGGNWSTRLRFETNQDGAFESYGFDTQVKDLFLARRFGRHRVTAGLSSTPTFAFIEAFWGKRYLMRTPLDLQGIASRDVGVALDGPLNASASFSYRLMLAPGVDFGADGNDAERQMVAISWSPSTRWFVEGYLDHEERQAEKDRNTLQLFIAYQGASWRLGVQYSHQFRQHDPELELGSAFLVRRLGPDWQFIGRVDRLFRASPKGDDIAYLPFDPSAPATLVLGALERKLSSRVRLAPNVVGIRYDRDESGMRARSDLHLRLTLLVDFE